MKNVIVLVLALMSSAAFAASDAAHLQQMQEATKACKAKGFKTVGEQEDCVHAAYVKIKSGVPDRGALYAEKNYKGLSKAQAEGKLISLQKEYDKAPKGTYFKASKKAGEVDRISIMNEGWWIQKNILGARQTQGDPWFMECKDGAHSLNTVNRCPLGKGGAK